MLEDGNCLFRAVADQVYGDSELYDLARQMCIDYMVILLLSLFFFNMQCYIILMHKKIELVFPGNLQEAFCGSNSCFLCMLSIVLNG